MLSLHPLSHHTPRASQPRPYVPTPVPPPVLNNEQVWPNGKLHRVQALAKRRVAFVDG